LHQARHPQHYRHRRSRHQPWVALAAGHAAVAHAAAGRVVLATEWAQSQLQLLGRRRAGSASVHRQPAVPLATPARRPQLPLHRLAWVARRLSLLQHLLAWAARLL